MSDREIFIERVGPPLPDENDYIAAMAMLRLGLPSRCECDARSGELRDDLLYCDRCADCGGLVRTDRERREAAA